MATYNQVGYGSKDSQTVTELQKLLNQNGANLNIDGKFGPQTLDAVKKYQQANNLAVDGIVGKNTWGALTKANSAGSSSGSSAPAEPTAPTFEYKPSDTVAQADALLQQHIANKPGEWQGGTWNETLNDTIKQILNREKFSYDLNGDALYQQYKDQYITQGKLAMMDTMGQAQAMTGGYGNSYAQTVGQQAYQAYLQQLNDVVPELYGMALDQYNQEGQDLYNQASLMAQMDEQEYGRYRDTVADYYSDLSYLTENSRYMSETEYQKALDAFNIKYSVYRDEISDKQWQAQFDETVRQYDQSYALSAGKSNGRNTGNTGSNSSAQSVAQQAYQASLQQLNDVVKNKPGNVPTGFTGTSYSEAVAYMESKGVPSANASGVMTNSEWTRRKNTYNRTGTGGAEVANYASYAEYLAAYVEYATENYSK